MQKAAVIIFLTFVFFLIEFFLFNVFGRAFKPDLMILLIMFVNLYWGIRYSIFTAFAAGIMKDSFSTGVLGVSLFSFIACAYLTTFFKKYIYQAGSRSSRLLLVFAITVSNVIIQYLLYMKFSDINFIHVLKYILVPDVLTTLLVATYTFQKLKSCVSKLSV